MVRSDAEGRGRQAQRPSEIPTRGWRDILYRVKTQLVRDHVSIVAAGVAFYALLAIFPGLAAAVSLYGLIADPAAVEQQVMGLSGMLPQDAQRLIGEQMHRIVSASGGALGVGLIVSVLIALWTASQGTKALMTAMNIAYGEREDRSLLAYHGTALLLTLGAIVFGLLALSLIAVVPALLGTLGLGETGRTIVSFSRWPLLAVAVVIALAVLYRYGPSRDHPQLQWVSWGAVAAAVLWLIASALFSLYVSNFGSYNETYGSLGAIIILLTWFYLTAYIVILGAEINAEMEHQTRVDTTVEEPEPMGERGAAAADTVGEQPR